MPRHDPRPARPRRIAQAWNRWTAALALRKGRPKSPDAGGLPVDPDKPKGLSGGAEAALDFDDQ